MRAPLGLQTSDELVLWGLLGATLKRADAEPALMATPYWMLKHLGLATGGSQYADLRDSLLRLSVASYHNTAFYHPTNREREFAAFQFLSILLPTVGGVGETVDNDRCWRVEWNSVFGSLGLRSERVSCWFQFGRDGIPTYEAKHPAANCCSTSTSIANSLRRHDDSSSNSKTVSGDRRKFFRQQRR